LRFTKCTKCFHPLPHRYPAPGKPQEGCTLLEQSRPFDFNSDHQIAVRVPKKLEFQFTPTFSEGPQYCAALPHYGFDAIPNDIVLISDFEREKPGFAPCTFRFKLNYQTIHGQNVYVVGSLPELGLWDIQKGARMMHSGSPSATGNWIFTDPQFNWQMDLTLPNAPGAISYRYIVRSEGSPPRIEGGGLRYFSFDVQKRPSILNSMTFGDGRNWFKV